MGFFLEHPIRDLYQIVSNPYQKYEKLSKNHVFIVIRPQNVINNDKKCSKKPQKLTFIEKTRAQ